MNFEKIVIIKQQTWLDGLVEKFNTKQQAKFYIEHMGGDFSVYQSQHNIYYSGLKLLKQSLPTSIRYQVVDKSFLPSFLFGDQDLVIVYGRDGLVINTAKYLKDQAIIGINPNPDQVDGTLLPFTLSELPELLELIFTDKAITQSISMVKAETNKGQVLYGVNDIFIGHRSHQSARYTIQYEGSSERQSSSGIIISSGMGSTGWYKSIVLSALKISGVIEGYNPYLDQTCYRFDWDSNYLKFCVREPWPSQNTGNSIVHGTITSSSTLVIESHMPEGGVIFGDGIEKDRIQFNSGTIVTISLAKRKVNLYVNNV